MPPNEPVAAARAIAEDLLFPAALDIERSALVPAEYLDALAAAGLYGLVGPRDAGGLAADATTAGRVIEAIGGASLTTAFVWIQHHSAVTAAATARPELRDHWLEPLCAGRVRAGVAVAALRRPGPPAVTATPLNSGWLLDGTAPWVTGWDRIDVILVAAKAGDQLVWSLVDAASSATLAIELQQLAAMAATATVAVDFRQHPVAEGRVVGVEPFADWRDRDRQGLRTNGYLAIGVAARAASMLRSSVLQTDVDAAREALDRAADTDLVAARADASLLAVRATSALVVAGGGQSMNLASHAQRLARDAMFLLVFGQTGSIRTAQLAALTGDGEAQPEVPVVAGSGKA